MKFSINFSLLLVFVMVVCMFGGSQSDVSVRQESQETRQYVGRNIDHDNDDFDHQRRLNHHKKKGGKKKKGPVKGKKSTKGKKLNKGKKSKKSKKSSSSSSGGWASSSSKQSSSKKSSSSESQSSSVSSSSGTTDSAGDNGTGDNGTGDNGTGDNGTGDNGTGDNGTGDNGTGDNGTGDNGTGDNGTGDNGTGDNGTGDNGTGDNGTGDNGTGDNGTGDNGTGDNGTGDNGTGDNGTGDNGTGDNGTGDNGTGDNGTGDNGTGDNGSGGGGQDLLSQLIGVGQFNEEPDSSGVDGITIMYNAFIFCSELGGKIANFDPSEGLNFTYIHNDIVTKNGCSQQHKCGIPWFAMPDNNGDALTLNQHMKYWYQGADDFAFQNKYDSANNEEIFIDNNNEPVHNTNPAERCLFITGPLSLDSNNPTPTWEKGPCTKNIPNEMTWLCINSENGENTIIEQFQTDFVDEQ